MTIRKSWGWIVFQLLNEFLSNVAWKVSGLDFLGFWQFSFFSTIHHVLFRWKLFYLLNPLRWFQVKGKTSYRIYHYYLCILWLLPKHWKTGINLNIWAHLPLRLFCRQFTNVFIQCGICCSWKNCFCSFLILAPFLEIFGFAFWYLYQFRCIRQILLFCCCFYNKKL